MPAAAAGVRVHGLRELNRAFAKVSKDVKRDMRNELKRVGEPVRTGAEALASARISNIGPVWSRMKLGATTSMVHIARAARRRGGSPRPNLGRLLLSQAMLPAREEAEPQIVAGFENWLDHIADTAGF